MQKCEIKNLKNCNNKIIKSKNLFWVKIENQKMEIKNF